MKYYFRNQKKEKIRNLLLLFPTSLNRVSRSKKISITILMIMLFTNILVISADFNINVKPLEEFKSPESPDSKLNTQNADISLDPQILHNAASYSAELEWNRTWGGKFNFYGNTMALDSSNNIYIGGNAWLAKFDNLSNHQWNVTWGGNNYYEVNAIGFDSSNNIYLVGYTESFGAGESDIFLLKYDSSGILQWHRIWGGSNEDIGYDVAIDSSNNIYVVGYKSGYGAVLLKYDSLGDLKWNITYVGCNGYNVAVDSLDNIYIAGNELVKFDNSGIFQWNVTLELRVLDYGNSIAIDTSNNIYVGGYISGYGEGGSVMSLFKYSSSGIFQWNVTWDEDYQDYAYGVVIDSLNYVYLVGYTKNNNEHVNNMILLKYDNLGVFQWNVTWFGDIQDDWYEIAIDSSNNVYLMASINFYRIHPAYLVLDILLLKYNNLGELQWTFQWGGTVFDYGYDVALDSLENVYLVGCTQRSKSEGIDMGVVKYDHSGELQWSRIWGGKRSDVCTAITFDSSDNIYLAGFTDSFGPKGFDICLVKYDSSGNYQWNRTWGETTRDFAYGAAVDSLDNIYIVGYTMDFYLINYSIFLLKYDSSGILLWNVTSSEYGGIEVYDITVDSSDNIYIVGGGLNLAKYNSSGALQWNMTLGGGTGQNIIGVAVDSLDNIYVGGTIWDESTWYDIYLAKFDSSGIQQWNVTWNASDLDRGYDIIVDSFDNIYLTGLTLSAEAPTLLVLLKYDSSGELQWNVMPTSPYMAIGGPQPEWSTRMAIDSYNNTYIGGTIWDNISSYDMCIVKYSITPSDNGTVTDITVPTLSTPSDITYEQGTTVHNITWIATDAYPDIYTIYKDGIEIVSGNWASGIPITINVDGLSIGSYNYTIVVFDVSGNSATDTVIVTVIADQGIPGYSLNSLVIVVIAVISVITIVILKQKLKH